MTLIPAAKETKALLDGIEIDVVSWTTYIGPNIYIYFFFIERFELLNFSYYILFRMVRVPVFVT